MIWIQEHYWAVRSYQILQICYIMLDIKNVIKRQNKIDVYFLVVWKSHRRNLFQVPKNLLEFFKSLQFSQGTKSFLKNWYPNESEVSDNTLLKWIMYGVKTPAV